MTEELNPQQTDTAAGEVSLPETQVDMPRRNFLKLGLGVLSAAAVLEVGAAGLSFLQPRGLDEGFGGVVTAGPVDSFPPGSVTEFPTGRFFLIRSTDGGFLAAHSRCPHLGCTVSWTEAQNNFHCPCHASSFDFYGNLENPPVPRALDIFRVQIQEAAVLVDTSRLLQREEFAPEQLIFA